MRRIDCPSLLPFVVSLVTGCAAAVGAGERDGGVTPEASVVASDVLSREASASDVASTSCTRTIDRVRITVTDEDARTTYAPCMRAMPSRGVFSEDYVGSVVEVSAQSIRIGRCPPTVDCDSAAIVRINVDAVGLDLSRSVLPGAFVQVHLEENQHFSCTQRVTMRLLPQWRTLSNPAGPNALLVFAASEGRTGTLDERVVGGLSINPRLRCPAPDTAPPSCGGPPPGDYELEFLTLNGSPAPVLAMGEEGLFELGVDAERQVVRARNLRSYESGACDDYTNFAWWIVGSVPMR